MSGKTDSRTGESVQPADPGGADFLLALGRLAKGDLQGALPLLDRLPYPALHIGPDYELRWLNGAARKVYGESADTCFALAHDRAKPCDQHGEACPKIAAEKIDAAVTVEHVHKTRDGYAVFHVTAVPVEGGGVLEFHSPISSSLTTDSLTGVYSRHVFELLIERQLVLLYRMELSCAFVLVDLDDLKSINDLHGHAAGDRALVALAQAIEASIRSSDTVGRLGGDEFCVALPATRPAKALHLVERIQAAVREARLPSPWADVRITASFGIHTVTDEDLKTALAAADRALYAAKSAGRDRIETV